MRLFLVSLATAVGISHAPAAPLSDADREALIERLDALKQAATERLDARFRAGFQAYGEAVKSDDDALAFYLKCVEKVDFLDQKKKESDFREWKRKEDEKLSKPAFKLALRHQLNWLSLTCQAASENADRERLAAAAQNAMDAVFRDIENLKDQQGVLRQSVTATVFAKAYEIGNLKVEKWSNSPVDIQAVYENILMPPMRNPSNIDKLRETWLRRIQQEGAVAQYWAGKEGRQNPNNRNGEESKIGISDADARSPEMDRFLTEMLPVLGWQMEMDLFKAGDQAAAAVRMIGHIEKHIADSHAKDWSEQFRALLNSNVPIPPKPTAGK